MSADPIDLTTVQDVKDWLSTSSQLSNANDIIIQRLITAASKFVLNYIGRSSLDPTVYDDRYDTGVQNFLVIRNWPVISISSIQFAGHEVTNQATGNPPTDGYLLEPPPVGGGQQRLTIIGHTLPRGRSTVRVQYTAGFATIPTDISLAACELVGERYKARERIGLNSKNLPNGETVVFQTKDMNEYIRSSLQPYRRISPA